MKKVLVFLLLVLSSIGVSGQKYPPVQPYNENGYKVSDLRRFLYENTSLSNSYQTEFLRVVNKNLRSTGEYLNINDGQPLDESCIPWVLAKISIESKNLKGFMNSRNKNGQLDWYFDKNSFYGPCFIFRFGNCSFTLAKTICMNLLDIPADYVYSTRNTKQPERQFREEPINDRPVRDDWRPIQEPQPTIHYVPTTQNHNPKIDVLGITVTICLTAIVVVTVVCLTNNPQTIAVVPPTQPTNNGNPGGTGNGNDGGGPGGTPPSRN